MINQLRILAFEAIVIAATIYAIGAVVNKEFSREYWVANALVVASIAVLPKDAYLSGVAETREVEK